MMLHALCMSSHFSPLWQQNMLKCLSVSVSHCVGWLRWLQLLLPAQPEYIIAAIMFAQPGLSWTAPEQTNAPCSTGLLKRYMLQPFESWLFPPKQRETTIYKL